MIGIPIYPQDCRDFSTNGLGLVFPTECTVSETINGEYTLHMVVPLTSDGRWRRVTDGVIVKVRCPMRECPDADGDAGDTQNIYTVSGAARAGLFKAPDLNSEILGRYPRGTELLQLDEPGTNFTRVSVIEGGATGYMQNISIGFDYTVTLSEDGTSVNAGRAREQFFRVYSVSVDVAAGEVTAEAMHVFYDLRGNIIGKDCEASEETAASVARTCFKALVNSHDFTLHEALLTKKVSGDYGWMSIVNALLDESTGIVTQANGTVYRDNWDVYLLPEETHKASVTLRRGKNIVGLTVNSDDSEVITRIIPCGQDKDGENLFLEGVKYVDSTHINDYPVIHASKIDYDVKVGDNYKGNAAARSALRQMALEDYKAGCDLPAYGMEVDFTMLEDEGIAASLKTLHIGDIVSVFDDLIGLDADIKMTAYEYDVILERYNKITLGDFDTAKLRYWGNANISGSGYLVERPLNAMAEASQDDCEVSASSAVSSSHTAYRAFDYNVKRYWKSSSNDAEPWIQMKMDLKLTQISVKVYSHTHSGTHNPKAGRVMGSNDGTTWTQIGSFSGWSEKKSTCLGTIECGNTTAYQYVRLVVTTKGSAGYVCIGYIVITGQGGTE